MAFNEPVWRSVRTVQLAAVPAVQRRWLLDRASLTLRLCAACEGRFRVQVLQQGWRRPEHNEADGLGASARAVSLVREVLLLCDEVPWVYARTVIPRHTLCGRERRLAGLGSRPLGAVLFADPGMRRGELQIARLTPGQTVYARAVETVDKPPREIWGRRSVFTLHGKPLLVSEVFLPAIPAFPEMAHVETRGRRNRGF